MSRAIFIDCDGTLRPDSDYLRREVKAYPGAREALATMRELGYKLFLLSNQSGVARGYHTLDDVRWSFFRLATELAVEFDGECAATELEWSPGCYRKPSPRYINEMIALHHLDPARCWMIGDRDEFDGAAGRAANINVLLLGSVPAWAPSPRGCTGPVSVEVRGEERVAATAPSLESAAQLLTMLNSIGR